MQNSYFALLLTFLTFTYSWGQMPSEDCILNGLELQIDTYEGSCREGSGIAIASLTGSGTMLTGTGSGTSINLPSTGKSIKYTWEYIEGFHSYEPKITETQSYSDTAYALKSGLYSLRVEAGPSCTIIDRFQFQSSTSAPLELELDSRYVDCGDKGIILLAKISNGQGPYSYKWEYEDPFYGQTITEEDTFESFLEFKNVFTGKHYIELTDANGCQVNATIDIAPNEPCTDLCEESKLHIELEDQYFQCSDTFNLLKAYFYGGVAPYTYSWTHKSESVISDVSETSSSSVRTLFNVSSGLHQFIITDSNGCTAEGEIEVKEFERCENACEGNPVDVELDIQYQDCGQNEKNILFAHFFGGEAPYTYRWIFQDLTGEKKVIDQESMGSVKEDLNVLPGLHTFEIKDSRGCAVTKSIEVKTQEPCENLCEDNPVDVELEVFYFECGDTTNILSAHFFGGVAPYHYKWMHINSDGQEIKISEESLGSVAAKVNVPTGIHVFEIEDSRGCKTLKRIEVQKSESCENLCEESDLKVELTVQYGSCADTSNSIIARVKGGEAPFVYYWAYANETIVREAQSRSAELKNVPPGEYRVEVIDANGCISEYKKEVTTPFQSNDCEIRVNDEMSKLYLTSSNITEVQWFYNGNAIPGAKGITLEIKESGTYGVIIFHNDGCTSKCTVTIETALPCDDTDLKVTLKGNNEICANLSSELKATVEGGIPPFAYRWTAMTGTKGYNVIENKNEVRTDTLTKVYPGFYTLEVTDALGCTSKTRLQIDVPSMTKECLIRLSDDKERLLVENIDEDNIQWYYNDEILEGETSSSITIRETGFYGLVIFDDKGCNTKCEILAKKPEVEDSNLTCDYEVLSSNDFERNWGIWNDGGSDAARSKSTALSGDFTLRIRDNSGRRSTVYTNKMALRNYKSLKVNFDFVAKGMEPNEQFLLEYSMDGGLTFRPLDKWVIELDEQSPLSNSIKYSISEVYNLPELNDEVVLRFRCDASNNGDRIFLDNIEILGCKAESTTDEEVEEDEDDLDTNQSPEEEKDDDTADQSSEFDVSNCFETMISNESFEDGLGVWRDGGSDMSRTHRRHTFDGYAIRLRDNSRKRSSMYTDDITLNGARHIRLGFAFKAMNFDEKERFVFEYSTDGGISYMELEEWVRDDSENGFVNDEVYQIERFYRLNAENDKVSFRFRADASSNRDMVYIDNVVIHSCGSTANFVSPSKPHGKNEVSSRSPMDNIHADEVVELAQSLEVSSYPNPFDDFINVEWEYKGEENGTLEVYSSLGRLLTTEEVKVSERNHRLNLSSIPSGLYFIRLKTENQSSEMMRVIKNK